MKDEQLPIIEITLPEEAALYIIEIPLDDGCIFVMDCPNASKEDWALNFPGGFSVTCPHGSVWDTETHREELE
jgi:hypothetical protein